MGKYEFGIIKEYGENEALIDVGGKEYLIYISDKDTPLIEEILLSEDIEYILFDTENENIIFENALNMSEENNEELIAIDEGVTEEGKAE